MANVFVDENSLKDIADVIRKNNGTDNEYKPYEMADAVQEVVDESVAKLLEGKTTELFNDKVTHIKNSAFYYDEVVKSVHFPNLKTVGKNAFYLSKLETFIAPNVEEIGNNALRQNNLINVDVSNVRTLGEGVFQYTKLQKTPNMPNITILPYSTFSSCDLLTDISSINEQITELKGGVFSYSGLVNVFLPNVIKASRSEFRKCPNLKSVNMPLLKTVECNDNEGLFYDCSSLIEVDLPSLEESYGRDFYNCKALTTISLPSLKNIYSKYYFYNCINLTSVELPNLETCTERLFQNCKSLKKLSLPKLKKETGYICNECSSLVEVDLPSLEETVSNQFFNCRLLETVNMPKAVFTSNTTSNIFSYCYELKNITLKPNSLTLGIQFYSSSKLSDKSIQNIIDALAPVTSSRRLSLHSSVLAKLTEEQLATIASKNWTVG